MIHRASPFLLQLFFQFIYHPSYHDQYYDYHYSNSPASNIYAKFLPNSQLFFYRIRNLHFLDWRNLLWRKVDRILLCFHLRPQIAQTVNGKLCLCVLAVGYIQLGQYYFPILSHSSSAQIVALSGGNCTSTSFSTTTLSALFSISPARAENKQAHQGSQRNAPAIEFHSASQPASMSDIMAGTPFSTWLIAAAKAHIVALSFTSGTKLLGTCISLQTQEI